MGDPSLLTPSPSTAGSSIGTTARDAQAALRQEDEKGRGARLVRLAPLPVVGWLVFVPVDVLSGPWLYAGNERVVVGIRLGVGLALVALFAAVRRWPPKTALAIDAVVVSMMAVLNAALAAIGSYSGGFSSIHAAGAIIVMAVPSFVELPWQRGARAAAAALAAFAAGALLVPWLRGVTEVAFADARGWIVFGSQLFLMGTMGMLAVAGGHLGNRLRQQVYESRSIGRYRLKRLLGKGGMGEVWAAYHTSLKRDVALKILREASPRASARFEREVQALADLRHPNTVRVFDYGVTDDGLLYYAMELLEGVDLGTLVRRMGALPPARAVHVLLQAARALGEAHKKGMVHRDVKPENLFVASAGGEVDFVKVLDFGIVRFEREDAEHLTLQGQLAGTPAFMAPEVGMGREADARSDVYALGAVLYFLLTGMPPFSAKGTAAMLTAHQTEPVVPPSLRMQEPLPTDVERLVLACLAKDPAERPTSASELADRLATTELAGRWTGTDEPAPTSSEEALAGERESSTDQATRPVVPLRAR